MAYMTLTWNEFLLEAKEFLQISRNLNDNWEIFQKNENEGNTFLIYKKKLQVSLEESKVPLVDDLEENLNTTADDFLVVTKTKNTEIFSIEYHVLYSISYEVPILYLQVQRNDGSIVKLEDVWLIFGANDEKIRLKTRNELLSILTPMEHPVLFKPYYAIHPCKTAELLGQTPASQNRILTFISLMGPYVQLNLSNAYGLEQR